MFYLWIFCSAFCNLVFCTILCNLVVLWRYWNNKLTYSDLEFFAHFCAPFHWYDFSLKEMWWPGPWPPWLRQCCLQLREFSLSSVGTMYSCNQKTGSKWPTDDLQCVVHDSMHPQFEGQMLRSYFYRSSSRLLWVLLQDVGPPEPNAGAVLCWGRGGGRSPTQPPYRLWSGSSSSSSSSSSKLLVWPE